jgi:hypothetical protein
MQVCLIILIALIFISCVIIYCNNSSESFGNSKGQDCSIMAIAPSTTTGPRLPIPKNSKYILFQLDCGGLNNIRMQYEILTVIAWLSGRTLVLHPKTTWYLLGNKQLFAEDIFDFDCWASQIPVLTAKEWLKKLGKPDEPDYRKFFGNLEAGDYGKVHEPRWSPGKTKFKPEFLKQSDSIWYFYCDRLRSKQEVETFRNLDHRMLGNTECYFDYLSPTKMKEMRRLLWDCVKFKEHYYQRAQSIMNDMKLKPGSFNALHLRNWEGKQPQYRLRSQEEVIDNLMDLDRNTPILFLSHDVMKNMPERIREKVRKFLESYKFVRPPQKTQGRSNSQHEQSIIDMLLATCAHRFYGSPSSTYSTGIMQLRGNFHRFCDKIDDQVYFMDKKNYNKCRNGWAFDVVIPKRWKEMYENV